MNSKNRFIMINLLSIEFALLNVVLFLYLLVSFPEAAWGDEIFLWNIAKLALIFNLSWLFIVLFIRDNEFYFNPNYQYFKNILISLFFFVGFVYTLMTIIKNTYFSANVYLVPIFIFSYLNLICHKYSLRYLRKKGAHLYSNTLLISSGQELLNLNGFTKVMGQYGYNIVGYLQEEAAGESKKIKLNIKGQIKDLPQVLATYSIDEIFIAMSSLDREKITKAIEIADTFGKRVKLIPNNPLLLARNYRAETMGELAVFKLRQSPLDSFNKTIIKRLFDFCFALVVIIIFAPVFLLISLLILIDSRGPVFYTPYRKGEAGETFKCYKFRTMSVNDHPVNGARSTIVNDPRITTIGKFLRRSDLDELPQFLNVLRGEMSIIGPRPHRIYLQNDFRRKVDNYMVRSYIKPGITGWAQVNGWRGPTNTEEQRNERIRHDLWYIENWSFWLDLKIIFLTLFGKHRKKAF